MQIFQIACIAHSGKSLAASIMSKELYDMGYIPVILPFAKALKIEATNLGFGKDNNPEGYRNYCQEQGALKRKENPDHWVDLCYKEIKSYLQKEQDNPSKQYVIIQDDVRYMNELALGKKLNAYCIFISKGRTNEISNDEWRKHESEILNNSLNEEFINTNSFLSSLGIGLKDLAINDLFNVVLLNNSSKSNLTTKIKNNILSWVEQTNHILIQKGTNDFNKT